MKVLKTLDFTKHNPTLICIEILEYRQLSVEQQEIQIKKNEIYDFLIKKNYKKVWSGSSYCSHLFTK